MRTRTQVKRVYNLTREEFNACHRLNLGLEERVGRMKPVLNEMYKDRGDAWAFMLWSGTELIAWALVWRHKHSLGHHNPYVSYFYTLEEYRRQGFGARLHWAIHRKLGRCEVVPWDHRSTSFFDTMAQRTEAASLS